MRWLESFAFRSPGDLGQNRRVAQHRRDFGPAVILRVLDARLHDQDRRRVLVDEIADDVVEDLRVADPGRLHHRDLLDARIRHRVHDAVLVANA
jgi:hypothetical protein